jgi:hypothetical protein
MWACLANAGGGGKRRVSLRTLVMLDAAGEDIARVSGARGRHVGHSKNPEKKRERTTESQRTPRKNHREEERVKR